MFLIKQYFVKYIFGCKLTNCQDISRSRIRRRSFDMMLSLRLYPNNKKWHSSRAYVVIWFTSTIRAIETFGWKKNATHLTQPIKKIKVNTLNWHFGTKSIYSNKYIFGCNNNSELWLRLSRPLLRICIWRGLLCVTSVRHLCKLVRKPILTIVPLCIE